MLRELTPRQLGELVAFERIEPGGEERDDLRAALIATILAPGLVKKRGGARFRMQDFMLDLGGGGEVDPVELSRQIRAVIGASPRKK